MRTAHRTVALLRSVVLTATVTAAMVVGVSGAANAAWNDSAPIGTDSVTTGSLGIDPTTISGGSWTKDGGAFDPATGRLTAGTTLVYTVPGVSVTAVGNNLEASFRTSVTGAVVPDAVKDHVTFTLASTPQTIKGSESDGGGKQAVTLRLTLAADSSLSSDEQTITLTGLTVTLQNSHGGWTDTATLDAGTLTTGTGTPPGGTVAFVFDLGLDADRTICLYLTDPHATIRWGDWSQAGVEATTSATTTGKYCHTYPPETGDQAYVTVAGTFKGLGSPDQTVADIGALMGVNQWTDAVGTTSAAYAFYNAVNMTYIDGAPSSITDMSSMFENASTATDQQLSVNGLVTKNVTSMRDMFAGAGTINWWSIVNASLRWDTSKVVDMSGMFKHSTIGSDDLAFDTSSVRDMSSMFEGATGFDGAIGGWSTGAVTTMDRMFYGASSFNQDLSGWDVGNVTAHADFGTGAGAGLVEPIWGGAAGRSARKPPAGPATPTSEPTPTPSGPATATPEPAPSSPPTATPEPTPTTPPDDTAEPTGPEDTPIDDPTADVTSGNEDATTTTTEDGTDRVPENGSTPTSEPSSTTTPGREEGTG